MHIWLTNVHHVEFVKTVQSKLYMQFKYINLSFSVAWVNALLIVKVMKRDHIIWWLCWSEICSQTLNISQAQFDCNGPTLTKSPSQTLNACHVLGSLTEISAVFVLSKCVCTEAGRDRAQLAKATIWPLLQKTENVHFSSNNRCVIEF